MRDELRLRHFGSLFKTRERYITFMSFFFTFCVERSVVYGVTHEKNYILSTRFVCTDNIRCDCVDIEMSQRETSNSTREINMKFFCFRSSSNSTQHAYRVIKNSSLCHKILCCVFMYIYIIFFMLYV